MTITVAPESVENGQELNIEIVEQRDDGIRLVNVSDEALLEQLGKVPLPPYIRTSLTDRERYQTVYSRVKGSVAAPTAGLHFTPHLLSIIQQKGINLAFATLHIGLDTFRPVRVEDPKAHPIHKEYGDLKELAESSELLISEICRRVSLNHGTTKTHLRALVKSGLIEEKIHGRIKIYRYRIEDLRARSLKNFLELWDS